MARDALAIADAEGLTRFHLAGHSMGGVIAQQIALAAPERVISLALLCTFPARRGSHSPDVGRARCRTPHRIGSRRHADDERSSISVMPPATRGHEDVDALAARLAPLFGHDLADQPAIVMTQLRAMGKFDALARLKALAGMATLVVSARYDVISRPALGPILAAAIPGARFVEIADAGHGVTIQRAPVVNAALMENIARART